MSTGALTLTFAQPSPNRILATRGHDFNAFPIPFEVKRFRNLKLSNETGSWIPKTGDGYKIVSGSNDGSANQDAYARATFGF